MADLISANAPPASYADFTAAQRSLYGAGMLPRFNVAVGVQSPGADQDAARGAALGALPKMPPIAPPSGMTPWTAFGLPRPVGTPEFAPTSLSLPTSMLSQARTAAAQKQQTPSLPTPVPAAPLGGGASPESAAPNVIQGGVPGATMPSEVPGMLHPADHAIAYEQHLARQRSVQPFNGTNGDQFTTLGPDTPGPGPAAAINVIRGGVQSGGAGPGSGMNLMQFEAVKPLIQARMQAQQLNPAEVIPNELIAMAKARRDNALKVAKTPEDQEMAASKYEQDLYRAINQSLALIQMLGGQQH